MEIILHTVVALAVLTAYTILELSGIDADVLLGVLAGQAVGAGAARVGSSGAGA